jgi:hypothetical protein
LNKRVKILEKLLKKAEKEKGDIREELEKKPREDLSIFERVAIIDDTIREQSAIL